MKFISGKDRIGNGLNLVRALYISAVHLFTKAHNTYDFNTSDKAYKHFIVNYKFYL